MTYTTKATMIAEFTEVELIQLTDILGAGIIDDVRLGSAMDYANAKVDAALSVNYTLPLSPIPQLLVDCANDLARWRLYDAIIPPVVERRYEEAMKCLDLLMQGKIDLGQTGEIPKAAGMPDYDAPGRTFTFDNLADY